MSNAFIRLTVGYHLFANVRISRLAYIRPTVLNRRTDDDTFLY